MDVVRCCVTGSVRAKTGHFPAAMIANGLPMGCAVSKKHYSAGGPVCIFVLVEVQG
jgi:hypothetical protein